MRTRNELDRLAASWRPLLSAAESLVDAGEQNRILARIVASPRSVAHPRRLSRPRIALAFGVTGIAVVAAVAVIGAGRWTSRTTSGNHSPGLTGAKIALASYRFRTPAGFKTSTTSCLSAPVPDKPRPAIDGFAAAASADGGCLEAAYLIADQPLRGPADAQPVAVGQYHGYFVSQAQRAGGQSSLFVDLPKAGGDQHQVSLLLLAQDLTEEQLIAVAESGLPTLPSAGPTATTGTETTG